MPNQTTQLSSRPDQRPRPPNRQLVQPPDMPAAILLRWPQKPSITTPDIYSNVAASCMQVLSAAVIELAAIRTRRRL